MLKVGEEVADVVCKDQNDNEIALYDLLDKDFLILYFYPKNFTPGCTKEACEFNNHVQELENLNTRLVGVSRDSSQSHRQFISEYNLGFDLISDSRGELRKIFKVRKALGLLDGRVTFVLDKSGTIVHVFESMLKAAKHVEESLRIIRKYSN